MQTFKRLTTGQRPTATRPILFTETGACHYRRLDVGREQCDGLTRVDLPWCLLELVTGHFHTVALTEDGSLQIYGEESECNTTTSQPAQLVKQLVTAEYRIALRTADGQVWVGVVNDDEPLENAAITRVDLPERVLQLAAGGSQILLLTEHGQVWRSELQGHPFTHLDLSERVIGLFMNDYRAFLLSESGQLWVCGGNEEGQLGLGDTRRRYPFTLVDLSEAVKQLSAGSSHTAVVTESGRLWVCGYNTFGQLGLGDNEQRTSFTHTQFSERVLHAVVGYDHTLVVSGHNQKWICGYNLSEGMFYNRFTPLKPSPLATATKPALHTFALITDNGQLWLYGAEPLEATD